MIDKLNKCPVCGKDIVNVFLHVFVNHDDKHISFFIDPVITYVKMHIEDKYAFEITKLVLENQNIGKYYEPNSLNYFISGCIPMLGYSIRKCVSFNRKKSDTRMSCNLSSIIERSIPRTIKNLAPNIFILSDTQKDIYSNQHQVEITKIFRFAAAHHLPNHPRLCQYTHGHEWKLEISVYDKVDVNTNMVIDFSDLKKIVNKYIIDVLDHNYVNDIVWNPTAENLCSWIFDTLYSNGLTSISKLRLWEAVDSYAVIERKDFFHTTSFIFSEDCI